MQLNQMFWLSLVPFTADWLGHHASAFDGVGIALSFWHPVAGDAIFVLVALLWLRPDRRIERALGRGEAEA
ncbi:MAG: hypothetical protein ACRD1Y_00325 [Terriglobales bacterium]